MLKSFLAAVVLAATTLSAAAADKSYLMLKLKSGEVKIELLKEVAPNHVARIKALTKAGKYDGIAWHRVMEGFMAQTGDVRYGRVADDGSVSDRAGYGGSDMPDLKAEFSDIPFDRGIVGAARGGNDINSANSQFFIMVERNSGLDGSYTVWGRVVEGMPHVDNIKLGARGSGIVTGPDKIIRAWIE